MKSLHNINIEYNTEVYIIKNQQKNSSSADSNSY